MERCFEKPTAYYHGKLQDGLALDPLTGYMRRLVPFFTERKFARQILLTKSADVENLLDLDHQGHTILSWTVQPPNISEICDPNTPSIAERTAAMKCCAAAGYPVRAVLMPLIPVEDWIDIYAEFLTRFLQEIPLQRLTIGSICSYRGACDLMNRKLGTENLIFRQMRHRNEGDGRIRYSEPLRETGYRHLIQTAKRLCPGMEIGLCLETYSMFGTLGMTNTLGKCNCVL
jgi:spore photoproduct lyase